MSNLTTILITLALSATSLTAAWAGDMEDAVAAYQIRDYGTAFSKFKNAAAQGNSEAQKNLGVMYTNGQGVKQDYAEAVRWYMLAAALGNADAQGNLGVLYYNGQGVKQDYAEALRWYKLAAAQGDVGAQNELGAMYTNGQGVKQDFVRAHMWFNIAALKGEGNSARNKNIVEGQMIAQQIAQAQKLARDCLDCGTWIVLGNVFNDVCAVLFGG